MGAVTDKVTDSASDKAVVNAWRLVADVGGTNARFAVASDEGSISLITRYSVDQYPSIEQALSVFLDEVAVHGYSGTPDAACFALAGPIDGDKIRFTNSAWVASRSRLSSALGGISVDFLNDFAAIGNWLGAVENVCARQPTHKTVAMTAEWTPSSRNANNGRMFACNKSSGHFIVRCREHE